MLKRNGISYRIINGSTIELTSEFYIEPVKKEGELSELRVKDEVVKLGHTFKFPIGDRQITYKISHIEKVNNSTYLLFTELRNRTSQYILPILGRLTLEDKTRKEFTKDTANNIERYCNDTYLINAYIEGSGEGILTGYLYLKFRFSPHRTYQTLEQAIVSIHPLYVKTIDLGDSYTYVKFRIPKEFMNDLNLFMKGKYSMLSEQLKRKIIQFYHLKPESNMYQILHQGDIYRKKLEMLLGGTVDGELDSIPDKHNEMITL